MKDTLPCDRPASAGKGGPGREITILIPAAAVAACNHHSPRHHIHAYAPVSTARATLFANTSWAFGWLFWRDRFPPKCGTGRDFPYFPYNGSAITRLYGLKLFTLVVARTLYFLPLLACVPFTTTMPARNNKKSPPDRFISFFVALFFTFRFVHRPCPFFCFFLSFILLVVALRA